MQLLAPAKLNLYLRVGPRGSDDFHPLLTWMVSIGLFDTLKIAPSASGAFEFMCSDPSLPIDPRNLVVRALEALCTEHRGAATAPLRIELHKSIPHGAGLGGGSSDAASALRAANELLALHLSLERLRQIAAALGSDVPFFLFGPSSVCSGRGEIVRPLPRPKPRWALLVLPDFALSTAQVYQRFDELNAEGPAAVESDEPNWQELAGLSATELLPWLVNDLERAAFSLQPRLLVLRDEMEQALRRPMRMSGSGSSLFTLFDEEPEARAAAGLITRHYARAIAVKVAPEQVPG